MRGIRIGLVLSTVAVFCFLLGCAAMATTAKPEKETTIRVDSPFKAGHILVDSAEKFKELVTQRSGGRIAVQIEAGTKSEEEINTLNSTGALDMQSNGTMFIQVYAPPYYFVSAPYVMKDFDHYMRVWDGKLGRQAQAQMEQNGNLKFLETVYRGLRQTTAKKPIYTPAVDELFKAQ